MLNWPRSCCGPPRSPLGRCLLAELIATTFLVYVGLCIEAQVQLSRQTALHSSALGWGMALVFAVQIAFPISGAHLNPAISLVQYTFGHLPFRHFLLYSIVQTVGGFIGAMFTFILYYEKIRQFSGSHLSVHGPNSTAAIFGTYPGPHLSLMGAVIDQISSTFILCFSIGIITDKRNGIPKAAQPPMFGLMLAMICMGFGLNAGNAMNPARDFGPRLFSAFAGYGRGVFTYHSYTWFVVPILCPFIGALLGSWAYRLLIPATQMPEGEEEELPEKEQQKTKEWRP